MTVTLPLSSQGQAYPDDWYVASVTALITLPVALYIPGQLSGGFPVFYLPMDLRVAANSGMNSYATKIEPGTTGTAFPRGKNPEAFGASLLILEVTRSWSLWWFVYSTTFLVPLAFFLLFFHILFLSKWADREPLYVTLLNILTMVVTAAAIRQLLIPGDLQGGLTRLDLWLGWSGMALLTLFFSNYTWQSVKKSK